MSRHRRAPLVAAIAWLVCATSARAACDSILRREAARFAKTARQATETCAAGVLAGRLPAGTDCTAEAGTAATIAAAGGRLAGRVTSRCCGTDRTCGTGDDIPLAAAGWSAPVCPNLENDVCTGALADPGDVAACLTCAGGAAVDRVVELVDERFALALPDSAPAACQAAIDDAGARFFLKASKALRRCWEARVRGAHANDCPVPGDGRAAAAITRARDAMLDAVCRACGGADGRCGGADDLPVASIGFLDACPALVPPGGSSCAGPIAGPGDVARCAACVGEFAAGCFARLPVAAVAAYPAECNPPRPACSAGVPCTTSLDCPASYTCHDNGGGTRECLGVACAGDGDCAGGGVCRAACTIEGCGPPRCQCPGFACAGSDEVCLPSGGGFACHRLCTQDSDCTDPFGFVCINAGFGSGICIGTVPCQ